jgi:uncharacterized membrane protein
MTTIDKSHPDFRLLGFDRADLRALATMMAGAAIIIPTATWVLGGIGPSGPESLRAIPDLEPLVRASPMILLHLAVALTALGLGVWVLAQRKGTRLHKAAGRIWAGLVIGAAVTGWLVDTRHFTAAHAAALLVFWIVPSAIVKVRRGDVRGHRRAVAHILIAMLIVAALALLPGHVLHGVFFSAAG